MGPREREGNGTDPEPSLRQEFAWPGAGQPSQGLPREAEEPRSVKFSTSGCQTADRLGELLHPTGPPEGATAGCELGRVGWGVKGPGTGPGGRSGRGRGAPPAARVCPAGPALSPGRTWNRKLAQSLGCVHGGRNSRSRAEWNQRGGGRRAIRVSAPPSRAWSAGWGLLRDSAALGRGGVGCRSEAPTPVLAFSQESGRSLEAAWCVRTHKWARHHFTPAAAPPGCCAAA